MNKTTLMKPSYSIGYFPIDCNGECVYNGLKQAGDLINDNN